MGTLREAVRTPVSIADMKRALRDAWVKVIGSDPSKKSINLLTAHWSLETGDGASMICYNVGNHKAHPDPKGPDYCLFKTWEQVTKSQADALVKSGHAGKPVTALPTTTPGMYKVVLYDYFMAFTTLEAGCEHYIRSLRKRFSYAWPAVEVGDVKEFAIKLREQRYYTAPLADYIAGMRSRYYRVAAAGKVDNLAQAQDALAKLGYQLESPRGILGPLGRAAVIEFQRAKGLTVDGVVGPQTRGALAIALDELEGAA